MSRALPLAEDRAGAASAVELWLPCPDYEVFYEVSNLGRVRSKTTGKVLALHPDRTGYPFIGLTKNGRRTSKNVHRLVCRAFHGEPEPSRPEAAHLDGNRTNCRADNLSWVGKIENHFHMRAHGTHQAGEKHPLARLTETAVAEIRASKGLRGAIAAKFGISKGTVTDIRGGRCWLNSPVRQDAPENPPTRKRRQPF